MLYTELKVEMSYYVQVFAMYEDLPQAACIVWHTARKMYVVFIDSPLYPKFLPVNFLFIHIGKKLNVDPPPFSSFHDFPLVDIVDLHTVQKNWRSTSIYFSLNGCQHPLSIHFMQVTQRVFSHFQIFFGTQSIMHCEYCFQI